MRIIRFFDVFFAFYAVKGMTVEMADTPKLIITASAIFHMPDLLRELHLTGTLLLIADTNTYRVAGSTVASVLKSGGWQLTECIFERSGVLVPDERALGEILIKLEPDTQGIVAVGSGVINDLARFVGARTGKPYLICATAPSMDGFASPVSPLTIAGFKRTYSGVPPAAIIGDPDLLTQAPLNMLQAGFGDILGKYTALADWELGRVVNGEAYSAEVAAEVRRAVDEVLALSDDLNTPVMAERLMRALVISGEAMLAWGNSRPASGAEHHLAHFWEMRAGLTGKTHHLHGIEVGVAGTYIAELYHRVFSLNTKTVRNLIAARSVEPETDYQERINWAFGPLAREVFDDLKGEYRDEAKRRSRQEAILAKWDLLRERITPLVPSAEELRRLLQKHGASVAAEELGFDHSELLLALENAKEVRTRYTIFRLAEDIGIAPNGCAATGNRE